MREYSFPVKVSLAQGLRQRSTNPVNAGGLVQCQNAVPFSDGKTQWLEQYNPPSFMFSEGLLNVAGIIFAFPFPQIFRGKEKSFILTADEIHEITTEGVSFGQLTTYDADIQSEAKAITGNAFWHFMDFYGTYAFFNGTSTILRLGKEAMFGGTEKVFVNDSVNINSGCAFKGRGVMGGFTASNSFNDHWKNTIDEIQNDVGLGIDITSLSNYLKGNYVWWSSIGGGDLFMLFFPELVEGGVISHADFSDRLYRHAMPLWQDAVAKNQMGWMPMPWQGDVNVVKKLGDAVMVYGDGGIAALVPSQGTFGLKHIASIGVSDRHGVGGNEDRHAYVNDRGSLFTIGKDLQPKELYYSEFMTTMVTPIVIYNEANNLFYISDNSSSYVLSDAGLGSSTYLVSSCQGVISGEPCGYWMRGDCLEEAHMLLTTDKFDMGNRGRKIIERVSVETEDTQGVTVAIDWRNSRKDSFTTAPFVVINYEGEAVKPVMGVEFRVRIKSTNYANTTPPTRITVHWKPIDKRSARSERSFETIN